VTTVEVLSQDPVSNNNYAINRRLTGLSDWLLVNWLPVTPNERFSRSDESTRDMVDAPFERWGIFPPRCLSSTWRELFEISLENNRLAANRFY
jgi:hypothetical protein